MLTDFFGVGTELSAFLASKNPASVQRVDRIEVAILTIFPLSITFRDGPTR
jgi:hypothetical protein